MQLVSENIPGFALHDSRCLPCSGLSGRTIAVSFSLSHRLHTRLQIGSTSRGSKDSSSYVCGARARASSSGYRRNPDFSKQNKHGFSRNRNKKKEDRDGFDNFEQSDVLSSKNGSLLSFSNSPRYQPISAPGPREKEIVALFRKVQAQLRERAANKDEKKIEASGSRAKESETVDSLLKLLRKHSVEQSKKKSSTNDSNDFVMDQQERNGSLDGGRSEGPNDANNTSKDDTDSAFSRPTSNFRRRSPVSRVKSHTNHSDKTTDNSIFNGSSNEMIKQSEVNVPGAEPRDKPEFNLELDAEQELDPEPILSVTTEFDETLDESDVVEDDKVVYLVDQEDLSALKVSELRELAKSRGVKGYSKMKKGDLLELLSRSSI